MESKIKHFMYVPFTGLGLYGGFRGNRWLKNRIEIFKQFVVPSLKGQTCQDFTVWFSWRPEERNNPIVKDFMRYMGMTGLSSVHTFSGCCFYDDKYEDAEAKNRLATALHGAIPLLFNEIGEARYVFMTIQPSDDLYEMTVVENIQRQFKKNREYQAISFQKGYICNYRTKELAEYNPTTNPPFYTIKFPRDAFIDPYSHIEYTSLKRDVGKYKIGTPIPSHEYVGDCLRLATVGDLRGFLVGTHGENISTTYVHPFKGRIVDSNLLKDFNIYDVPPLEITYSLRKKILQMLPHRVQRKIRYLFGERIWQGTYNFLRS